MVHAYWSIISIKKATVKQLYSLEGILNHAAYIVPSMRHFLSHLRALHIVCDKSNKKVAFLPKPIIDYLHLCKEFYLGPTMESPATFFPFAVHQYILD